MKVIDIVLYIFKTLSFDKFTAQVSLRDPNNKEKYIGSDENWHKAEQAIIEAAAEKGLKTTVEMGEAAFYGPKLDFMVRDAIGRQVAARHHSGRLQSARALRPDLQRLGRQAAPADHDPPRALRLDGALRGRAARAYGRQVPAVALARSGGRAADQREIQRLCEKSFGLSK